MRQSLDIQSLLASGANVTISVTTEQLRDAFLAWGAELLKAVKPEPQEEWIDCKDAARILGVSVGTIRNHVKRGWLHPTKQGGIVRFKKSEVLEFNY